MSFASDILNDPNFKVPGGFTIRRYTTTVDDDGIGVKTFTDIHAEGAIVPSGALGVARTPEVERQGSGITIYTETPIVSGDASLNRIADDVIYNNQIYQVTSQDDYSQWGFNVAEAILQDPGGRPLA